MILKWTHFFVVDRVGEIKNDDIISATTTAATKSKI